MPTNRWGIALNTKDASGDLQTRVNVRRDDVVFYVPINTADQPIYASQAGNRILTLQ